MPQLFAKILFFPIAAILLGLAWQAVHPDGFWSLPTAPADGHDDFARVPREEISRDIPTGEFTRRRAQK